MSILDSAGWPIAVVVAVASTIAIARGQMSIALGILLAAASLSGINAMVGGAGIRIEQPAVLLAVPLLVARERAAMAVVLREGRWPIAFALVFLGANVASAVLSAPDVAQSLKICLWLATSELAALVAATLVVAARPEDTHRQVLLWVVVAACVQAVVAGIQVVAEIALRSDWGVLRSDVSIGKAFGLAWEPNLLAIQLAAALMFILAPESLDRLTAARRLPVLLLIAAGIALSLSRGGIVAAIAGIAVLILAVAVRGGRHRRTIGLLLGNAALVVAISVGGYIGISWLAAHGVGLRPGEAAVGPDRPQGTLLPLAPSPSGNVNPVTSAPPAGSVEPTGPAPTGPAATASATATARPPNPTPDIRYLGAGDTIELRVRNLQIAVADGLTSPILGLGPDTFGQRYVEPTCSCPAHVPNQLSATFYESGLVGLGSLLAVLAWVLVRAWQRRLNAYVAALATLLVGFQFTDALRFGGTWILIGAMVGLIVMTGASSPQPGQAPSDRP